MEISNKIDIIYYQVVFYLFIIHYQLILFIVLLSASAKYTVTIKIASKVFCCPTGGTKKKQAHRREGDVRKRVFLASSGLLYSWYFFLNCIRCGAVGCYCSFWAVLSCFFNFFVSLPELYKTVEMCSKQKRFHKFFPFAEVKKM